MLLLCKDISHWLGANLESALYHVRYIIIKSHTKSWNGEIWWKNDKTCFGICWQMFQMLCCVETSKLLEQSHNFEHKSCSYFMRSYDKMAYLMYWTPPSLSVTKVDIYSWHSIISGSKTRLIINLSTVAINHGKDIITSPHYFSNEIWTITVWNIYYCRMLLENAESPSWCLEHEWLPRWGACLMMCCFRLNLPKSCFTFAKEYSDIYPLRWVTNTPI